MRRPDNEPLLFDLPLDRPARDDEAEPVLDRQQERPARSEAPPRAPGQARPPQATERAPSPVGPPTAPVSPATASAPRSAAPQAVPPPPSLPFYATATAAGSTLEKPGAKPKAGSGRVGIGRRLAAGAADLLMHLAVAVLALAGCRYLGVVPALRDWPAGAVFLLSFSFLYTVVPLAFWGRTLGMTWAGLTAESSEGEPLSFDQTARRWLGALLTLATLGLALLVALTGRSLSDRLSGSRTLPA